MKNSATKTLAAAAVMLAAVPARAGEMPIGDPVEKNHMEIAAVYLQPVMMEPEVPRDGRPDAHIEADIHAIPGNPNGFGAGEWIPYLDIAYRIEKLDSDWSTFGTFQPMVAADGPHYAANVAFDGAGKYRVTYRINPPSYNGFMRHTDKETGVGAFWEPFEVSWEFAYLGTGKKGGY